MSTSKFERKKREKHTADKYPNSISSHQTNLKTVDTIVLFVLKFFFKFHVKSKIFLKFLYN